MKQSGKNLNIATESGSPVVTTPAPSIAPDASIAPITSINANRVPLVTPLAKLKQTTDILLMLYPKDANGYFTQSITPDDEILIYNLVRGKMDCKPSLLILLDTSGGNVYSAVKIMDTLRTKYPNDISIAVPQAAKSSGTMMCCGADKILMTSISELGPLDKPMVHPADETSVISALDIVKSIDGMIEKALEDQRIYAVTLNKENSIPLKKALELAGDAISKLISPMLCREDVKIYNQAKRLLVIANVYASELLGKHMFGSIKSKGLKEKIINAVTHRLIWDYPDHSFAIRRDELKEWFFTVEDTDKLPYWDELWKEFADSIGSNSKKIKFI